MKPFRMSGRAGNGENAIPSAGAGAGGQMRGDSSSQMMHMRGRNAEASPGSGPGSHHRSPSPQMTHHMGSKEKNEKNGLLPTESSSKQQHFKSFSNTKPSDMSAESAENLVYERKKYEEDGGNVQLIDTKNGQLIPKDKELKAYLESKSRWIQFFVVVVDFKSSK